MAKLTRARFGRLRSRYSHTLYPIYIYSAVGVVRICRVPAHMWIKYIFCLSRSVSPASARPACVPRACSAPCCSLLACVLPRALPQVSQSSHPRSNARSRRLYIYICKLATWSCAGARRTVSGRRQTPSSAPRTWAPRMPSAGRCCHTLQREWRAA